MIIPAFQIASKLQDLIPRSKSTKKNFFEIKIEMQLVSSLVCYSKKNFLKLM